MDMWPMGELVLPIRSHPELVVAGPLSSDERLARLVSRGSERAFATLYRRHHQALYRYCCSIVRDEDDAQDALQSAMTRALVALRSGERDLAVRPWLFRIVHNEAVTVLRRRRPTVALAEDLEPAGLAVEDALAGRERLAALVADLQALPERQRSALLMRELSGLPIEEIAAVLSTSPGATKQVLFEARRALHDFAEGRAMECEQVRRVISDGDRRVLRGRKLSGHLRDCSGCRDFQEAISARSADLHALAPPLPGVAATTMLARLLAHGMSGGHTGGMAVGSVGSGAAAGSSAAASLTLKALAGVATVTVAVAGGARLALVHRQHGHSPPPSPSAAPRDARLAPQGPLISSPPPHASHGRTARSAPGKVGLARASGSTKSATVPGRASLASPPSQGMPSASSPSTGHGRSATQQGHGRGRTEGRAVSHRSHAGAGSHRAGSSRPAGGGSAKRKSTPARLAKPKPRDGRGQGETGRPSARPPGPAGAAPQEKAPEHGAHSGSSPMGKGAEGQAPAATAMPDRPRSG
jgi:RNA polymerase sigma factor (sigma-70 family)